MLLSVKTAGNESNCVALAVTTGAAAATTQAIIVGAAAGHVASAMATTPRWVAPEAPAVHTRESDCT